MRSCLIEIPPSQVMEEVQRKIEEGVVEVPVHVPSAVFVFTGAGLLSLSSGAVLSPPGRRVAGAVRVLISRSPSLAALCVISSSLTTMLARKLLTTPEKGRSMREESNEQREELISEVQHLRRPFALRGEIEELKSSNAEMRAKMERMKQEAERAKQEAIAREKKMREEFMQLLANRFR